MLRDLRRVATLAAASLLLLAAPAPGRATEPDAGPLAAEIKAARLEAARADTDSPEQIAALQKLLKLQTRAFGETSPELIPTIRHLAATAPLDDPQRPRTQIPHLLRILKIQLAAGLAADADATRADLILYYDVSGQFAESVPHLRERVAYLSRTGGAQLSAVALDLSKHLAQAGDPAGARAALASLPRDCLDSWAPACAQASDQLLSLAMEADDLEVVDRLGAGLVRRLRGGDCDANLQRSMTLYFGYKGQDDVGHRLYASLLSNPACGPEQREAAIYWLEQGFSDYATVEPLRREAFKTATTDAARAEAAHALGSNLLFQQRPADAAPFLKIALDTFRRAPAGDATQLVYATRSLAQAYEATGRMAEALAEVEATLGHPAVAKAIAADPLEDALLTLRARYLVAQGRGGDAQTLLRARLERLQAHDWVYDLPDAVQALCDTLRAAGDPAGARQAMAAFAARFGRDPNVPRVERQEIRLRAARSASEDPATRSQALAEIRAVLGDIDSLSAGLAKTAGAAGASAGEALSGDLIRSDHGRTAALGLLLNVGYAERGRATGIEAEAFAAAQDLEVSAAARALAQAAARIAAGPGALGEAARREQALARDLQTADAAFTEALSAGDADDIRTAEAEVGRLSRELARADADLRRSFPRYAELASPAALPLAELRRRLRPGEGLLLVTELWNDVHVFAVSKSGLAWTRLDGGADGVAQRVARLRCQVDDTTCGEAGGARGRRGGPARQPAPTPDSPIPEFDLAVAHSLYRDLVAPVASALDGVSSLYVTATGPLSALPFGLLVTEPPAPDADTGSSATLARTAWFADRFALTTLPSVSSLRAFQTLKRAEKGGAPFLGFGDPVLKGRDDVISPADAHRGDAGRQSLANPEMLRTGLAPLPHTREELEAIARSLGATDASLRLGAAATEAAVKSDAGLASARVVAFATHGLIPTRLNRLDEPGLVFTPPDTATSADDGYLSASEAAALNLSADWLILSACNTAAASGKPDAESLSGLARAFLYAGAKALLASHWSVLDDATEALMVETLSIQRAAPDITKAQALQRAMAAVRTGRRADGSALPGWQPYWAHPAAWAAFVLIGAGE